MAPIDVDRMSPELRDVLERFGGRIAQPGTWPTPGPADGQTRDEWLRETALIRAEHDGLALNGGRLIREAVPVDEPQVGGIEFERIDAGDVRIGVRIYRPTTGNAGDAGGAPAIVLVHGGGYWMGGGAAGFELNDDQCRLYCAELGAVVVNVDHRLGPEHPWPAPADDVHAAVSWVRANAVRLGVDPDRILLHGISSGGNLVTSVVHRIHDEGEWRPLGLILQMPSLTLSKGSERYKELSADEVEAVERIFVLYADGDLRDDPRISPSLRTDLGGLPPTVCIIATFDLLAPDCIAYADRLREAGVPVRVDEVAMTHTVATPEVYLELRALTVAAARDLIAGTVGEQP